MIRFTRRFLFIAFLVCSLLGACAAACAEEAAVAEKRLADCVRFLASDELEGRGVDTKGLDRAADYIATQLAQSGLKTNLFAGTPHQRFSVTRAVKMGPNNRLALVGPSKDPAKPERIELKPGEDFNPLAVGGSGTFDLPLVFAGYGITGKGERYDDYAGIDVAGKAVLVLRNEPRQEDPKSVFAGTSSSEHATITRKLANAQEHKAAAVIVCTDGLGARKAVAAVHKKWQTALDRLAEEHAGLKKVQNPSIEQIEAQRKRIEELTHQVATLSDAVRKAQDEVLPFEGVGRDNAGRNLPVLHCRRSVLDRVVKSAAGTDLAALEHQIDAGPSPQSRVVAGWRAVGQTDVERTQSEVKNVVATLEGEGPLADETVVVGAHYDHLGYGRAGPQARDPKSVFNGADDNASGVAVTIEVARQLAQRKEKLRRRVVFAAFAAEEIGLYGSNFYVSSPPFPLEKTVAMVNLDMVGRLRDDKLTVFGSVTAARFGQLLDEMNPRHGFNLTKSEVMVGGSDHLPFQRRKVPAVHFFTGLHEDRHRTSDDWEKLNVPGMRRISAMVTELVVGLANGPQRPEYVTPASPSRPPSR